MRPNEYKNMLILIAKDLEIHPTRLKLDFAIEVP
jgi:hypothetical protein